MSRQLLNDNFLILEKDPDGKQFDKGETNSKAKTVQVERSLLTLVDAIRIQETHVDKSRLLISDNSFTSVEI